MAVASKPWDWKKNTQDFWNIPSEESYYLAHRWKGLGFARILDLGCGLGRHSQLFSERGFRVSAFDLSPEAISALNERIARAGLENVSCATGDMRSLPYADGTFDCLLAYHVISHTDTAGIRGIVGELRRVLRPGGEFFLTLCSKKSWSYATAGYPSLDENTVVKVEDGPENGVPHFYSDERTVADLFSEDSLVTVKHTQDLVLNGAELRDSWHYFILGKKR